MQSAIPQYKCNSCSKSYFGAHPGVCSACGCPHVVLLGGGIVGSGFSRRTTSLKDAKSITYQRWRTGSPEIDAIFGGGFVKDSVLMLAGERGAGKSTVLTKILHDISRSSTRPVLYASGEETPDPFKARAARLGASGNDLFRLIATGGGVKLSEIYAAIHEIKPVIFVVDSLQCVEDDMSSTKGRYERELSVTKEVTGWCKKLGICGIIIGQFTKEGIAGKYELQHTVDVVATLTVDQTDKRRVIDILKNRFGADNQSLKLAMTKDGLKTNEETVALSGLKAKGRTVSAGAVAVPIIQNGQPTVIELLAALFDHAAEEMAGTAKREVIGMDKSRFGLTLALMQKYCSVSLRGKDLFIEIPNSEDSISDRGMDLAVMAAVVSAEKDLVIPNDWAVIGSISVHGVVSWPNRNEDRFEALSKLGYRKFIGPKQCKHVNALALFLPEALKDHRLAGDVDKPNGAQVLPHTAKNVAIVQAAQTAKGAVWVKDEK